MSAWRWTDEQGVQRLVSTEDLRSALASGLIPGSALVWRQGMDGWARAATLPELADAAKGARKPDVGNGAAAAPDDAGGSDAAPADSGPVVLDLDFGVEPSGETPAYGTLRESGQRLPGPVRRAEPRTRPPPLPRKREPMKTLPGLDAPDSAPPSTQNVPIVAPAAGGMFDAGVARAITQLPRYEGPPLGDDAVAAVPPAPKLPSDRPNAAPKPEGGPAPRAAARAAEPPPLPPGRSAAPAGAGAAAMDGRGAAAATPGAAAATPGAAAATPDDAQVPPGSARPPPLPSSRRGAGKPARTAGRTVPPPPVPVRFPALATRRPAGAGTDAGAGARAADATEQPATGARAPARPEALPLASPRAPADALRAGPPPLPPPDTEAAPVAAVEAAGAAGVVPAAPAGAPAHAEPAAARVAEAPPAAEGDAAPGIDAPSADEARVDASSAQARSPGMDPREPDAAPPAGEVKSAASTGAPREDRREQPAPPAPHGAASADASSEDRREQAALPAPHGAASTGASSEDRREYATFRLVPGAGPTAWPGAQRGAGAADGGPGQPAGQEGERARVSTSGASTVDPKAVAARRGSAGRLRSFAQDGKGLLSSSVPVPVASLLGAGGVLVTMVAFAYFAGRSSAMRAQSASAGARRALGAAQDAAQDAARSAPLPAPPKPCWVARQPQRWAPLVAKSVPFEVTTTKDGRLMVGYARSPMEAMGIEVDPSTGERGERFLNRQAADIVSISPIEDSFSILTAAQRAILSPVNVAGPRPFVIGAADDAVVAADGPDAPRSRLWPLQGGEPLEAPRAIAAGSRGYALAFRRERAVWAGWLDPDRSPRGELVKVNGSGGSVGKPSLGWNERDVAVAFADRPANGRWEIRAGRASAGTMPASTQVIPLPSGGPGGDAFAPDIAGLGDGRWLLVWTEGPPGSRAMRAQTLTPEFEPLGDPIALSPPAGNFGQGVLGVSARSGYVGVVFLSKPAASYELWGVILQCG